MEEHKSWTLKDSGLKEIIEDCELNHKTLIHGNITIHLVECGSLNGDLVLLLHGFPNFWYVWKKQFKALHDAGYHIIAPDLRGYNTSSRPKEVSGYSRSEVIEDLVCLIECFNAGRPANIVGHDWGASLALCLAEDVPSMVRRLVVANGTQLDLLKKMLRTSIQQLFRSWYIFFIQLPWLPEWLFSSNGLDPLKKTLTGHNLSEYDVDRFVQAWSVPGSLTGGLNYYRAAFRGYWNKKEPGLPVNVPVTVIWGDLDDYLLPELANLPRDIFVKLSILRCPQGSHWPMLSDTQNFNNMLLDALSRKG